MSRRRTKAEEIRNPEHYFNRYVACERKKEQEEDAEYYNLHCSLDELSEQAAAGFNHDFAYFFSVNRENEDTHPSKSSFGKLPRNDLVRGQWYSCPATTERNGGSSERSSEGCRPVSSASCRSVAALAPGRSVEQERASKFQKQGRLCAIRAAPWIKASESTA